MVTNVRQKAKMARAKKCHWHYSLMGVREPVQEPLDMVRELPDLARELPDPVRRLPDPARELPDPVRGASGPGPSQTIYCCRRHWLMSPTIHKMAFQLDNGADFRRDAPVLLGRVVGAS